MLVLLCLFLHISMVMEWVRMLHSDWSVDLLNRALQPREDILFLVSLTRVKSTRFLIFNVVLVSMYISCFSFSLTSLTLAVLLRRSSVYFKQHHFQVAVYFMLCAFMWSSALCECLCISINWVKWPPLVNTSAGCVYSRYNALCLNVLHIMNVCLCEGVYQYLCVCIRVEPMTRCSGMRHNCNFGVRCTVLGSDPD